MIEHFWFIAYKKHELIYMKINMICLFIKDILVAY